MAVPKLISAIIKDADNIPKLLTEKPFACKSCKASLGKESTMVSIFKEPFGLIEYFCPNCLRVAQMGKNMIFFDTYPNFQKRLKTGFIKDMLNSYKEKS